MPPMEMSESRELSIVPCVGPSQGAICSTRTEATSKLRADREAHHHKQIWTKCSHGGPYQKVRPTREQQSNAVNLISGSQRPEDRLGYERVEVGLTTNFVGDQMTRGSIDVINQELEVPHRASHLLLNKDFSLHRDPLALSETVESMFQSSMGPMEHPPDVATLRKAVRQMKIDWGQ